MAKASRGIVSDNWAFVVVICCPEG